MGVSVDEVRPRNPNSAANVITDNQDLRPAQAARMSTMNASAYDSVRAGFTMFVQRVVYRVPGQPHGGPVDFHQRGAEPGRGDSRRDDYLHDPGRRTVECPRAGGQQERGGDQHGESRGAPQERRRHDQRKAYPGIRAQHLLDERRIGS